MRYWQWVCTDNLIGLLCSGINLPAWQAFTIKDQADGMFGLVGLGLTQQPDVLMQSYPKVEQGSKDSQAVLWSRLRIYIGMKKGKTNPLSGWVVSPATHTINPDVWFKLLELKLGSSGQIWGSRIVTQFVKTKKRLGDSLFFTDHHFELNTDLMKHWISSTTGIDK